MRTTLKKIFILMITLTSCDSIKKTIRESYSYEMYIDFKHISYQGKNKTQSVYIEIDSIKGMWYYGKLILNYRDTFAIYGFEKGSHYVTSYKIRGIDKSGGLEIWCRGAIGQIRDSLTIEDRDLSNGIVKEKTVLYRQPRISCL